MIPRDEFAARPRFGRVARIPALPPLGVGDVVEVGALRLQAIATPGPCEAVLPAHRDVIRDPRRPIAGYRRHHERRKRQMLCKLAAEPMSPCELASRLFPKVSETQVDLVMSAVIGHLDTRVDEGKLVRDGIELARAA